MSGGTGYEEGDRIRFSDGYGFDANITQVDGVGTIEQIVVNQRGFNISKETDLIIWDNNLTNLSAGVGAIIKPIYFSGLLTVEANATHGGVDLTSEILIRPSSRNVLSSQERVA